MEATLAQSKPHTLDDMMIAMDVVDTLRHREDLVRRELNEAGREAELIDRLREIYRGQGIEVPDHVLQEGVKALKEARFTYTPPPPSLKRGLFEVWTRRRRIGAYAAVGLTALLATCGVYHFSVTRPAQLTAERQRVELAETLPQEIRQAHADVEEIATDPKAKRRAAALMTDAERAIRDKDRGGMLKARDALIGLRDKVAQDYVLTIVSRPGETTGVWRQPPGNTQARNYYIIVEALAADGRKLTLPIRNEETGQTERVDKFGLRVPKTTYDKVAADKRDDGIVQDNRMGRKQRGALEPTYQMPIAGGAITSW